MEKCRVGKCCGGNLSDRKVLGGEESLGKCLGGKLPGWEVSGGKVSRGKHLNNHFRCNFFDIIFCGQIGHFRVITVQL